MSSQGPLPEGADPAEWVARQFAAWWRRQAGESLGDAEALHELTHVQDALGDLRGDLGLADDAQDS